MKGPFRPGMRGRRGGIILQLRRIAVSAGKAKRLNTAVAGRGLQNTEKKKQSQKMRRRGLRGPWAHAPEKNFNAAYCGQAAPLSTQAFIAATNSGRSSGGSVRPSPGFQFQPTSSSEETCSIICARLRWPFFAG